MIAKGLLLLLCVKVVKAFVYLPGNRDYTGVRRSLYTLLLPGWREERCHVKVIRLKVTKDLPLLEHIVVIYCICILVRVQIFLIEICVTCSAVLCCFVLMFLVDGAW